MMYSSTLLMRPPHQQVKSGLIWWVASREGDPTPPKTSCSTIYIGYGRSNNTHGAQEYNSRGFL